MTHRAVRSEDATACTIPKPAATPDTPHRRGPPPHPDRRDRGHRADRRAAHGDLAAHQRVGHDRPGRPSGWSTVYSDDFAGSSGSGVDSSWTYDTGTQYTGTGCTADWGTSELETDTDSTANVSEDGGGHLDITPVGSGGSWTSGRIETVADDFEAPAGGEMEVSASVKQPDPGTGLGYWPAFWMLGAGFRSCGAGTSGTMDCSNWPSTGEIDVMEDVNALSADCTATATSDISADCYGASDGTFALESTGDTDPSGADSKQVAELENGDWLEYPDIGFGTGSTQFDARVASGASGDPPFVSLHYFDFPAS